MTPSNTASNQLATQACTLQSPSPLTVAQIAAQDFRKAAVFQKFGIDFCCGGGITLAEASKQAGISEGELRSALQLTDLESVSPEQDFVHWDLGKLVDYIVNIHHKYVRDNVLTLIEFARKVAGHHGKDHPELVELDKQVRGTLHDLLTHMEKEEKVLFPAIRLLVNLEKSHEHAGNTQLHFIRHAVEKMREEHSASGEELRHFRQLTNNYTLPEGACNSYQFLFDKLREFETDLHQHIHLENNILFPRSVALLDRESPE